MSAAAPGAELCEHRFRVRGTLGRWLAGRLVAIDLRRLFAHREHAARTALERQEKAS